MSLPLPIASYKLPSPSASSSVLVNAYVEQGAPDSTKGPVLLRRSPGIASWIELGDGPVRGLHVMAGVLYAVSADKLYSVGSDGTDTEIGDIPGSTRVQMSDNGVDLVIVLPTGAAYHYDSDGDTLSQITDGTFLSWGATTVDFLDGFFVFLRPDSQQFFNSGINEVTFNALDIASAEGRPDNINGLLVDHRELVLTGTESTELWYNAALSPGSPFARNPDGLLEYGSAAAFSLAKLDTTVFWLAHDLTVRRLNGNTPVRTSQHGIENIISGMDRVNDAFALTYTEQGHLFYVLQFPEEARTLVFDATTQQWHERESLGYGRWRPNCMTRVYGKQLAGDTWTGKIGILSSNTFEEWGEPQKVTWQYQPVYAQGMRAIHRRLELGVNTGFSDPSLLTGHLNENASVATLKVSNDGGNTFRTLPTRTLGEQGKYKSRVVWWKLGSARQRVYRMEITDPTPIFATDTQLDAEPVARI